MRNVQQYVATLEGPTHSKHPATVRGNVQQDEVEALLHPAQFTSKRLSCAAVSCYSTAAFGEAR